MKNTVTLPLLSSVLVLAAHVALSRPPAPARAVEHAAATAPATPAPTVPMAPAKRASAGIDPESYPMIGDEELGQLRHVLAIADQDPLDFKNLEGIDQLGMTSYRYAIAFMSYFLAVEQYYKLQAAPELIQPRMDRLIQKMVQRPVWEYWAGVSRGLPNLEPKMNKPYPEEHDPVAHRNIMYSGHVGHMIGLYEMLFRDFKYDLPGAITFTWSPTEKYPYDHHSLCRVMRDQMANNPWHGIECEPNAVFPECNQHPVLSFILHDQLHGSDLASVNELFLDFFLKNKMIDPTTHETAMLYLVKQQITLSSQNPRYKNALDLAIAPAVSLGIITLDSSAANGWTGAFMHAWQPDYIARHYPYQRDNSLRDGGDSASLKMEWWEPTLKYGFFSLYAAEMGDAGTRDKLLRFADAQYGPVWRDGVFRYPYSQAKKCTNLTGHLLAIARALPANGLWTMHNKPLTEADLAAPRLAGIDFPRVVLRRAVWDSGNKSLVFTTEPGGAKGGETKVRIIQLDPATAYKIYRDGREVDSFQLLAEREVAVPLDGRHSFVMAEE